MGAVQTNSFDSPGWHGVELEVDEGINLAARDVGFEAAFERREDFGVFSENGLGRSEFIDNGCENILLVLDAVHVAGAVGFAFTGVDKGARTIDVDGLISGEGAIITKGPLGE